MYLWNTKKLALQMASGQLSADSKFQYLIASNILFAVSGYLVWYFANSPTPTEFTYWFEALLVLIITVGGTLKCREAFAPATDLSLIESFFILSLPLSIKMTLFIGIALALIPWSVGYIAASRILESFASEATVLNAIHQQHSIVVMVIATSWFYWRMKYHLTRITKETQGNGGNFNPSKH